VFGSILLNGNGVAACEVTLRLGANFWRSQLTPQLMPGLRISHASFLFDHFFYFRYQETPTAVLRWARKLLYDCAQLSKACIQRWMGVGTIVILKGQYP